MKKGGLQTKISYMIENTVAMDIKLPKAKIVSIAPKLLIHAAGLRRLDHEKRYITGIRITIPCI